MTDQSPDKDGASDSVTLHCMEIRGGNQAADELLTTSGANLWIYSSIYEENSGGGDVHYVSSCGGGKITRLVIADVSGHGQAVAEFSDRLRTFVRKFIAQADQRRLVARLNQEFGDMAQLRRYATAIVTTHTVKKKRLAFSNAGHPRPLFRPYDTGVWRFLDKADHTPRPSEKPQERIPDVPQDVTNSPQDLPLGLDDDTVYHPCIIPFLPGDVVIFYSDALLEAVNSAGRPLGERGLLKLASELTPDPLMTPENLRNLGLRLLNKLQDYRDGLPPDDDLTMLVYQSNGQPRRRIPLTEWVQTVAKMLRLLPV